MIVPGAHCMCKYIQGHVIALDTKCRSYTVLRILSNNGDEDHEDDEHQRQQQERQ